MAFHQHKHRCSASWAPPHAHKARLAVPACACSSVLSMYECNENALPTCTYMRERGAARGANTHTRTHARRTSASGTRRQGGEKGRGGKKRKRKRKRREGKIDREKIKRTERRAGKYAQNLSLEPPRLRKLLPLSVRSLAFFFLFFFPFPLFPFFAAAGVFGAAAAAAVAASDAASAATAAVVAASAAASCH